MTTMPSLSSPSSVAVTSLAVGLLTILAVSDAASCQDADGNTCPCGPGCEFCSKPFDKETSPKFHLMDQHGCGENDPNGPSFDPVHGVIHHFYQIHLAAPPGHGPNYGHFVSKDFVHWAALPVAIWNGFDASTTPQTPTPYDDQAIYTGSAIVVDGAGPGGSGPGLVQIYPGLCQKATWPACETGTLLAQAVPADYAGDPLLTNWTKPSYNPIMENTQRDPSTPWQTASGEWRLRTYDAKIYAAASTADMLAGKWYEVGTNPDFRVCECPSLYPLPASTPGFEDAYKRARGTAGGLPTHVHKYSCGGDWWQLGNYGDAPSGQVGSFQAAPGWEAEFAVKRIDVGNFYASKDFLYPTVDGGARRINWGWAQVPPASTQTLPREITFNAAARTLQQYPIEELESLRSAVLFKREGLVLTPGLPAQLGLAGGPATQSELLVSFKLPQSGNATFGVDFASTSGGSTVVVAKTYMEKTDMPGGDYNTTHYPSNTDPKVCQDACNADPKCMAWTYVVRGEPTGSGDCCLKSAVSCPQTTSATAKMCTSGAKAETKLRGCSGDGISCEIELVASEDGSGDEGRNATVQCGPFTDRLLLLPSETSVDLRFFADATFVEAYFQRGRVAMTVKGSMDKLTDIALSSDVALNVSTVTAYAMDSIWVSPEHVRQAKRVYPGVYGTAEEVVMRSSPRRGPDDTNPSSPSSLMPADGV